MVTVELNNTQLVTVLMNNYNCNYSEAVAITEYINNEYQYEINLDEFLKNLGIYSGYDLADRQALLLNEPAFVASNKVIIIEER